MPDQNDEILRLRQKVHELTTMVHTLRMAHELELERSKHDREMLREIVPAVRHLERAATRAEAAADAIKRRRGLELTAWQQFLGFVVALAAVLDVLHAIGALR